MNIQCLTLVDFKIFPELTIEPPADAVLVILSAPNATGKTTIIEGIEVAIAGKKKMPPEPVRAGQSKGSITLKTQRFTQVVEFTNDKTKFSLVLADGQPEGAPITMLEDFYNYLTLDPTVLWLGDAKKRNELVRQGLGLDEAFKPLDARYSIVYHERHALNKNTVTPLKHEFEKLIFDKEAPQIEIDVSALTAEMQRRANVNAENAAFRAALDQEAGRIETMNARIEGQKETIEALRKQLEEAETRLAEMERVRNEAGKALASNRLKANELQDLSLEDVQAEIAEAGEKNQRYHRNREWFRAQDRYLSAKAESDRLTADLQGIIAKKSKMIAEAKWPVQGMSFEITPKDNGTFDEQVLYGGLPFEQASTAQKLRVSVMFCLALNPEFKVVLIRDGSLLDANSMQILYDVATEYGAQVWIERVADRGALRVDFWQRDALPPSSAKSLPPGPTSE